MSKFELAFAKPAMNAAGTLGFAPDPHGIADLRRLGAFVTNPVSLAPRKPAGGQRYADFPGGFLIHTGLPNPGLSQVLRRYASRWQNSSLPVLVHLLAQNPAEAAEMVRRLEGVAGVAGIELGLPDETTAAFAAALTQAGAGELPLVVRLPMSRASELVPAISKAGAYAASLAPPRGALPVLHHQKWVTPERGATLDGRLYGPAVFPLALAALQRATGLGLPIIAAGGVYDDSQVEAMLLAGALAVQFDAVLWRGFF
jgi:dihydroorotate dehydrogenase (NAD+) catalytic subunit